jgi:hypothetical protein
MHAMHTTHCTLLLTADVLYIIHYTVLPYMMYIHYSGMLLLSLVDIASGSSAVSLDLYILTGDGKVRFFEQLSTDSICETTCNKRCMIDSSHHAFV